MEEVNITWSLCFKVLVATWNTWRCRDLTVVHTLETEAAWSWAWRMPSHAGTQGPQARGGDNFGVNLGGIVWVPGGPGWHTETAGVSTSQSKRENPPDYTMTMVFSSLRGLSAPCCQVQWCSEPEDPCWVPLRMQQDLLLLAHSLTVRRGGP